MKSALGFLTIIPVGSTAPGYGAAWFPVVGSLLGLAAAAALHLPLGALCALILVAALTGGLHEDGLADVCDAVRAYRTRERMIEILRDSHIGAHGALAVVFSVLLRWQALDHLIGDPWIRLPAALGISRGMMVILAAISPSGGTGLGQAFKKGLTHRVVLLTILQLGVLSALLGWQTAFWLIPLQILGALASRVWFIARLGGINGDCLGFQCQVSEAASLALFTWV